MTDVQVLVVVLGEGPATRRLTPVILGIPRPDLDRQILPGGIERELESATVAGRSVVDDPKVAPTVQILLYPISPPTQLPSSQDHPLRHRSFATGSR